MTGCVVDRRVAISDHPAVVPVVSRFGLAVRRWADKHKDLGSNPRRLSFLFKNGGLCMDTVLFETLSLTINETLKWLLSLPILMQGSFWW